MYLIGRHNDARAMLLPVIACVFIIRAISSGNSACAITAPPGRNNIMK